MKRLIYLLSITFLLNIKIFSQCDDCKDIKKEFDSFDEKYLTTVIVGNLSGGSLLRFTNASLFLEQITTKTDTNYYFKFNLVIPQNLIFVENEQALVFKCDKDKISFKTLNSNTTVGKDFNVYNLTFKLDIDTLFKIINSKEVIIRVYASSGYIDRDFSFDEDYFRCLKCYYKSNINKNIKFK